MKLLWHLSISTLICLILAKPTQAIYNPLEVPNNHYGIHILEDHEIDPAAALVNSNGGDWGYVTLVIRENDRQIDKWQAVFDKLRRHRLIPLVRLATRFETEAWIKPRLADVASWVDFLNQLNWVIENRYVIIFNEPNHTREWGGNISPSEYATIFETFHRRLKDSSPDYFVLPAALDTAPENSITTMHPRQFLLELDQANPNHFSLYDGWTSHAYANPNFSGNPYDKGRMSIQNYLWELAIAQDLGYDSNKPIFITEAGWAMKDPPLNTSFPSEQLVAQYMSAAYSSIWRDRRIVAITPFTLRYTDQPFRQFSWLHPDTLIARPVYTQVQALPKSAGQPRQYHRAKAVHNYFPGRLINDSTYLVAIQLANVGQSIWSPDETQLIISHTFEDTVFTSEPIGTVEPGETAKIWIRIETGKQTKSSTVEFNLVHNNQTVEPSLIYPIEIATESYFTKLRVWVEQIIHPEFTSPE